MPFNSYVLEWVLWMEQVRIEKKISGILMKTNVNRKIARLLKKLPN